MRINISCLERTFTKGKTGVHIKGRDFYDLIWYMERKTKLYQPKLKHDGQHTYTVHSALRQLEQKLTGISQRDLEIDLVNLFENQDFIVNWLDNYQLFFNRYLQYYLESTEKY